MIATSVRRLLPALLLGAAFALLAFAGAAEACSVCSAGRDEESRWAFIVTTVFLSVLPLALIGGLVFWLRRRAIAIEAEDERARAGLPRDPALGPASL